METRIRKSLEIPARKHQRHQIEKETNAEKTYLLIINLWIFRFEYSKEQSKSWIVFRENLDLEGPCTRVFFMLNNPKVDVLYFPKRDFSIFWYKTLPIVGNVCFYVRMIVATFK
jgi:hypothetical protein